MRVITIDGGPVQILGRPLALLVYQQEFNSDLVGDYTSKIGRLATIKQKIDADKESYSNELEANMAIMGSYDSVALLKIVWALAKCAAPKDIPDFTTWVSGLESFDISDKEIMAAVSQEVAEGFFRGANAKKAAVNRSKKNI